MAFVLLLLAGCGEQEGVTPPAPVKLTAEAAGHYCMMPLLEHPGPKAQVHLEGFLQPIFFAQVRDALAYVKGPERYADLLALYVSDMGAAMSWENPGVENWIPGHNASYVIGGRLRGGMGAPELVPFSSPGAAAQFASRYGGKVVAFPDIPDNAVLGPVEIEAVDGDPQ